MSNGQYRYVNGKRYTFGTDGRWWHVLYSSGGDDYGGPVASSEVMPHGQHHALRHHSHHHGPASFAQASRLPGQSSRVPDGRGVTPAGTAYGRHSASAIDDPWQGNNYARDLFQGQGAKYFVGADHLVTRMAELDAFAYTAAFFAPEILSSGQFFARAYRIGPLGNPVGRIFWSGGFGVAGTRAAALAAAGSGTTLEMTPAGQWIESVAPDAKWLWKLASAGFARGDVGPVTSVQGDTPGIESVWATIEYGILEGKNVIYIISATGRW